MVISALGTLSPFSRRTDIATARFREAGLGRVTVPETDDRTFAGWPAVRRQSGSPGAVQGGCSTSRRRPRGHPYPETSHERGSAHSSKTRSGEDIGSRYCRGWSPPPSLRRCTTMRLGTSRSAATSATSCTLSSSLSCDSWMGCSLFEAGSAESGLRTGGQSLFFLRGSP